MPWLASDITIPSCLQDVLRLLLRGGVYEERLSLVANLSPRILRIVTQRFSVRVLVLARIESVVDVEPAIGTDCSPSLLALLGF